MEATGAAIDRNASDREPTAAVCDSLESELRTSGAGAAIDTLIRTLTERHEPRRLLDALLLKARHELDLPLITDGGLDGVDEAQRQKYEERYIDALRQVGRLLLDAGDIPGAWPYFRAIGEPEPVARAIEDYQSTAPRDGILDGEGEGEDNGDGENEPGIGSLIEVAFNQGANPRRGFELILEHYGTCSAITAFEHLPADETVRSAASAALVRRVHDDLVANLRAEIAQRGQPLPAETAPVAALIANRPWLFADESYHIDISHLGSVVRYSLLVKDPTAIGLAVELTDYGQHLSGRLQGTGEPPFDDHYKDYGIYLRALLDGGRGADANTAIDHFRAKLGPPDDPRQVLGAGDGPGLESTYPAQVLVGLMLRLNRTDEALDMSEAYLAGLPDAALVVPSFARALSADRAACPPGSTGPRARRPRRLHRRDPPGGNLSRMSTSQPWYDAREVNRIEVLATADDPARVDSWLEICRPGSTWTVRIRTAEVAATVRARKPLGSFSERDCTCLSLRLDRPVPVEPGLRLQIIADLDPSLTASGVIRPWS